MVPIAIAVVEHEGRFLIGIRPDDVPLPGLAEFPGGKMLPEETAEEAAVRECLEEAGLHVEPLGTHSIADHEYRHARVRLHFIACRVVGDDRPRAPFRWVPRDELAQLQFPAANAELISQLANT